VLCPTCGSENPDSSRFCSSCGTPLDVKESATDTSIFNPAVTAGGDTESDFSTEAHRSAIDALPADSALLVVKRGPNAGSRFLLDRDVTTAGRHPDSDIFLDDVTVSRRHVEFRRESGGFSVHDVGSLNGTYLNRERIDSAVLSSSDEVQIGKFRLVYLTSAAAPSA
jgi:FHA domain/zinc-ribbon domain